MVFRWKSGQSPVVVGMVLFGRTWATHRWSEFGRQWPEERESKREVVEGRERSSDFWREREKSEFGLVLGL